MNAHAPMDDFVDANMTSKGQVLIPKALRDRAGLTPNAGVRIGINVHGQVVVLPAAAEETREEKVARIRAAIEKVAGTRDFGFATTDEYMDFIRPWRNDPQ